MPLLILNPIFLLDENVDSRLLKFLKSQKINVRMVSKGFSDKKVAEICLKEKRILVTNDGDFQEYAKDEIYSVIWLRIPQNKPDVLIKSFEKLLSECMKFAGRIVILNETDWKDFPLIQRPKY